MDRLRKARTLVNGKTQPERVSIRERLKHFTWAQFEMTMSTGAISILLGQQPFTFRGLETIGKVFFIIDLVLFVLNSALITTRFLLHEKPWQALKNSLHHPHESFFFGAFWVSINLIIYSAQLYGDPGERPWLVKALEICFWIYVACAIIVVVFQYHVIFDREELPVADTMPAWVLPAYPFLVAGPLAAVLLYNEPSNQGIPILIGGLLCQGLGFCLAFLMYSLYFERLISQKLPAPSKRPGMYVAVGPAAYTANALVELGYQARRQLPPDYLGITSVPVGDIWYAIGVPAGICFWLLSFWFFAVAGVSVLSNARSVHFTLNYWAFIFPNAGLTVATIWIGNTLDSTAVKAVSSAMTVLLVAAWFLVAAAHVRGLWKRQILWPGMDEDEENIEGQGHDEAREHSA